MYKHLAYLIVPAFQVSGLYVQGKVVQLLAAIRDLRSKAWKASPSIYIEKGSGPENFLKISCRALSHPLRGV